MGTKTCRKCGVDRKEDEYGLCRGRPLRTCKVCRAEYLRNWRKTNESWDQKAYHAEWRERNRARWNAQNKRWRDSNKEKMSELRRKWIQSNPDKAKAIRERAVEKKKQAPAYKVHSRVKTQIRKAIRHRRSASTFASVGYTCGELMTHLERQFLPGMGWHNMNQWHIDHIVPLAAFDISSESDPDFKRAWSLPNLRPIWARDNLRKQDKRTHLL